MSHIELDQLRAEIRRNDDSAEFWKLAEPETIDLGNDYSSCLVDDRGDGVTLTIAGQQYRMTHAVAAVLADGLRPVDADEPDDERIILSRDDVCAVPNWSDIPIDDYRPMPGSQKWLDNEEYGRLCSQPRGFPWWRIVNVANGMRDAMLIAAAIAVIAYCWPKASAVVDSASFDRDGAVILQLGAKEFSFAPNIAREVASGLVKSAESAEGSAE